MNNTISFSEYWSIAQKLSKFKEEVIISYILNQDFKRFLL